MEFSDLYKQSNGSLVRFSPDGQYIAVAVEHRLIVRSSETPKRIVRVFSCPYEAAPFIQELQWSSDSQYILTASYATNRVNVWSIEDESWRCSITDEVARVEKALWAKDSRHVLTFSELDLRLSIWSLVDGEDRRYIQFPKAKAGISFHPDSTFMVLAQRHDYRDHLGIYNTEDWRLVREIPLDTVDVAGVAWSPDGLHIVAWDTVASFHVVIVNVAGMVKRQFQPEDEGLGIRSCSWSPTGQLLALAGSDKRIRVLNNLTWRPIATVSHRATVTGNVDVFVEVEIGQSLSNLSKSAISQPQTHRVHTRFDLEPTPATIRSVLPVDIHRADAKAGISMASFNAEGSLLASICESMPCSVWVWQVSDMRLLAVIQTMKPVRMCQWSPIEPTLSFVTGTSTLYLWKKDKGCYLYEIPSATVAAASLTWNPNGEGMAILSKGLFALAYITE
ncbi:hypothetical protein GGF46_002984 [Coemansia sp. RSA 552]|nr:hypothetical protein GGF46_002984 [Coemansia sp. RSA 552]